MASWGAWAAPVWVSVAGGAAVSLVVVGFLVPVGFPRFSGSPFPRCFRGFWGERERGVAKGQRAVCGDDALCSWSCRGPGGSVPVHAEDIETAPVERGGPGVHIGGDPLFAAGASLASTPQAGDEVADLAFHLGPGPGVSVLPFGGLLVGLVALQDLFMAVDADGPPRPVGGAAPGARASGAGRAEAGQATAIAPPADRRHLTGGAADHLCLQVDPEIVFGVAAVC